MQRYNFFIKKQKDSEYKQAIIGLVDYIKKRVN